jgi:mono/diheme cytochrome c family protein
VTDAQAAAPGTIDVAALEAEADRYLTTMASATAGGQRFYPVGQFDAFPEGIGNPLHIAPFFATEQSAPWGIDGAVALLEDFNNTVFTVSLDPTSVATPAGGTFLEAQAGAAGLELHGDYRAVLQATGVNLAQIPFVNAQDGLSPGEPASVVGRRVNDTALRNLNSYLDSLPSPRAPANIDAALAQQGRDLFRALAPAGGGCTTCHQVDPNKVVNPAVVPFATIYPGYTSSLVVIAPRAGDLAPIQNSGGANNSTGPNPFFDDRMIVLDGSRRGQPKGTAFPLLLDLVDKKALLHDDSVRGANFVEAATLLLNPSRGETAAHPFYIGNSADRAAVVEFLRSGQTIQDPETDNSKSDPSP